MEWEQREIEFRGKGIKEGGAPEQWIYGHYTEINGHYRIAGKPKGVHFFCERLVIPETVTQYVGLKDCEEEKIFEGDIARIHDCENMLILFCQGSFYGQWRLGFHYPLSQYSMQFVKIIGNIFDNPELFKEQADA